MHFRIHAIKLQLQTALNSDEDSISSLPTTPTSAPPSTNMGMEAPIDSEMPNGASGEVDSTQL